MKRSLFLAVLLFSIRTLCAAQEPVPSTQSVMDQAFAQAGKTHKKVLLLFHASWCGWCKKMEASLNDAECKKMFDDNYVITYLDVLESKEKANLENPGSMDLLKQYKGEKAGLPFWVILDAGGKLLADSQIRPAGAGLDTPGANTGCPSAQNEVAYFIQVLKATSRLKEADLSIIEKRFLKNQPGATSFNNR
jgi:thiol-disulfide isomerase/thioredoxin